MLKNKQKHRRGMLKVRVFPQYNGHIVVEIR